MNTVWTSKPGAWLALRDIMYRLLPFAQKCWHDIKEITCMGDLDKIIQLCRWMSNVVCLNTMLLTTKTFLKLFWTINWAVIWIGLLNCDVTDDRTSMWLSMQISHTNKATIIHDKNYLKQKGLINSHMDNVIMAELFHHCIIMPHTLLTVYRTASNGNVRAMVTLSRYLSSLWRPMTSSHHRS